MKKIAIQGICYDKKSSYLRGPAEAPNFIRKNFHSGSSNYYSELGTLTQDAQNISDKGDFLVQDYFEIERLSEKFLNQNFRLLTLGGDHSITFPIIKAHSKFYRNIEVLQIDAHCDLYDSFEGDPYSHACPFARIMENRLAKRLVQVGIRALTPHQREQAKKFQVEIQEAKDFDISEIKFENPVYISLDMDGFDPAFAPGVSHHEPGGLSARQVIDLIHSINVPIIGADIVEFNPKRDIGEVTAALAAKMKREILGKMISNS